MKQNIVKPFRLHLGIAIVVLATLLGGSALAVPAPGAAQLQAAYVSPNSVWPEGALEGPARDARLNAAAGSAIDAGILRRLTIGMTAEQVAAIMGAPLAGSGKRRWQYLVRDGGGPFVATVWFNEDDRLWIGSTQMSANAALLAQLAPQPVPAPVQQPGALPALVQVKLSSSVLFALNSDRLAAHVPQLNGVAAELAGDERAVVVKGYADRLGNRAHNLRLSRSRAESVRRYLAARGIAASRIQVDGLGSADPVVQCPRQRRPALVACLAPNRRVVIEYEKAVQPGA